MRVSYLSIPLLLISLHVESFKILYCHLHVVSHQQIREIVVTPRHTMKELSFMSLGYKGQPLTLFLVIGSEWVVTLIYNGLAFVAVVYK
jgi:hypothetical protein